MLNLQHLKLILFGMPFYDVADQNRQKITNPQRNLVKLVAPYGPKTTEMESVLTCTGVISADDRITTCLSQVELLFESYFSKLFIQKGFSAQNRTFASDMMDFVKTAFMVKLQEVTWLSEDTRKAALYKVRLFLFSYFLQYLHM